MNDKRIVSHEDAEAHKKKLKTNLFIACIQKN